MRVPGGLLERIDAALDAAAAALRVYTSGAIAADDKGGGDPVTAADHAVDALLRGTLPRDGEGWLSEESADDRSRLGCERVWVVDPLDGTREFVAGIPEWTVSIGLVVSGRPIAGGVLNPATGERVLGAVGQGLWCDGRPAGVRPCAELAGAQVLASRSEVARGDWRRLEGGSFTVRAVGSIAYKLALVAAGAADATWSLRPKHEWDVAGGAALVAAGGGELVGPRGEPLRFNQERPLLPGPVAASAALVPQIVALLRAHA